MTVTTNDRGQQNLFAKEPTMYTDETYTVNHNDKAEKLNGSSKKLINYQKRKHK